MSSAGLVIFRLLNLTPKPALLGVHAMGPTKYLSAKGKGQTRIRIQVTLSIEYLTQTTSFKRVRRRKNLLALPGYTPEKKTRLILVFFIIRTQTPGYSKDGTTKNIKITFLFFTQFNKIRGR